MVRQQKAEEHKRQTARILARQQAEIQAKMEEMHEQEIARQEVHTNGQWHAAYTPPPLRAAADLLYTVLVLRQLLARQKEEKARLAREKRAAIEERIKANFKKSRALERQRRVEFYKRQRVTMPTSNP